MALNPFADVTDVEEVWGELTVGEAKKVEAWLAIASTNLRLAGKRRNIDIDAYIAGDELLTEGAKNAVVSSVRRVLMNPTGARQRSTSTVTGPLSDTHSETVDSSLSSAAFYFSDEDLLWLPKKRKKRFGVMRANSGYYGG